MTDLAEGTEWTTLLFLEGEAAVAEDLTRGLHAYGYRLVRTQTLGDIPGLLQTCSIDAILADLDGGLEGATVRLEQLRDLKPMTIPMVLLSAQGDVALRLKAIRAGCDVFVPKPIDISELTDRLDELTHPVTPEPPRVLVVEDSKTQASFLRKLLEGAGMYVDVVLEPLRALDAIPAFRPDLILMDMYMPGCDGPELAALIRTSRNYLDIPIVYLSTETDTTKQLEALRQGADDFLTKNIRPEHLISSVRIRADRTRLLRGLLREDSLTGLLNHSSIKVRLEEETARARRQGTPLSVAMVDLDHFKAINDTHGHAVGDRVIQALSHLLRRRLRRTDIVGRYGGEEFAVVLPDTPIPEAVRLMDTLRQAFAEIPHSGSTGPFTAHFSAGVAGYALGDDTPILETADMQLYEAKRSGRNCVCGGI